MRVLFVAKELRMEPLGIMYLASALKDAGHAVELARCDGVGCGPEKAIQHFQPDVLAYSVCTGSEQFYFDLNDRLQQLGRFRAIFGGSAPTFSPGLFKGRDYIRGEAEIALVAWVEGREVRHLQLADVEAVADPDRALVYQFSDSRLDPIKNIITRRGCTGGCSYCFNRQWNNLHRGQHPPGIVRYRSVDHVVTEAMCIARNWPLRMINFVDDNFASSIAWLREFVSKWPHIPFFCSLDARDGTEEAIRLLAQAGGTVINLSLETANDETRTKVLRRHVSKTAVYQAIKRIHRHGMRTRLQNIIGLPVNNPLADAYQTLAFNIRCAPTSSWCSILQAFSGSLINKIAHARHMAPADNSVDSGFFGTSTLHISNRRQIERLHKLWPLLTRFPGLARFAPILIRLPLPFQLYKWLFNVTKQYFCERELWRVFR